MVACPLTGGLEPETVETKVEASTSLAVSGMIDAQLVHGVEPVAVDSMKSLLMVVRLAAAELPYSKVIDVVRVMAGTNWLSLAKGIW